MLKENERLTIEHAQGALKPTQYGYTKYWTKAGKFAMMNRLGEYEDTGCTPEEIREMKTGKAQLLDPDAIPLDEVVWMEERNGARPFPAAMHHFTGNAGEGLTYVDCIELSWPAEDYGTVWRCWSGKPTKGERDAEPWE